jgi:hypothetical protein
MDQYDTSFETRLRSIDDLIASRRSTHKAANLQRCRHLDIETLADRRKMLLGRDIPDQVQGTATTHLPDANEMSAEPTV